MSSHRPCWAAAKASHTPVQCMLDRLRWRGRLDISQDLLFLKRRRTLITETENLEERRGCRKDCVLVLGVPGLIFACLQDVLMVVKLEMGMDTDSDCGVIPGGWGCNGTAGAEGLTQGDKISNKMKARGEDYTGD